MQYNIFSWTFFFILPVIMVLLIIFYILYKIFKKEIVDWFIFSIKILINFILYLFFILIYMYLLNEFNINKKVDKILKINLENFNKQNENYIDIENLNTEIKKVVNTEIKKAVNTEIKKVTNIEDNGVISVKIVNKNEYERVTALINHLNSYILFVMAVITVFLTLLSTIGWKYHLTIIEKRMEEIKEFNKGFIENFMDNQIDEKVNNFIDYQIDEKVNKLWEKNKLEINKEIVDKFNNLWEKKIDDFNNELIRDMYE